MYRTLGVTPDADYLEVMEACDRLKVKYEGDRKQVITVMYVCTHYTLQRGLVAVGIALVPCNYAHTTLNRGDIFQVRVSGQPVFSYV